MQKSIGFIVALTFLANSVFVPTVAKAQTIPDPVSTSPVNIESLTTATSSSTSVLTPLTTYSVTLTSYNAVPSQTSATPWLTASGAHTNPQVIAARSHGLASQLPFGTIIAVMGPTSADDGPYCGYDSVSHLIGYRVIADTTNARFIKPRIDVQLDQNDKVYIGGRLVNPAVALGACTGVQIKVVGYVDPSHIPQTQAQLAALVNGNTNATLADARF